MRHLAGSVGGLSNFLSGGVEFKPHVGCGDYLKNKIFLKMQRVSEPITTK